MIFDPIARTFEGPAPRLMPRFTYLNRSSRPEAERVRAALEDWIGYYPESHRKQLVHRLRAKEDDNHLGAVFELILHEIFLKQNAEIIVEPKLTHCSNNPDFLIRSASGLIFYLEATHAVIAEDSAARKRLEQVYDLLDTLPSADFFIGVKARGLPVENVSVKQVRAQLERWYSSLNYDAVAEAWSTGDIDEIELTIEAQGAEITFTPRPKASRGKEGRLIGREIGEAGRIDTAGTIRERLIGKAKRYGRLDHPLIVAVNVFPVADQIDIMDALFGTYAVEVQRAGDDQRLEEIRLPDGVWIGKSGPRYRRLSAVLWTSGLVSWNIGSRLLELVPNPWAYNPVSALDLPIPRLEIDGDQLRPVAGEPLANLLGLPARWPHS